MNGSLNYTAFFSPAEPDVLIWGASPALLFPTGTSDEMGSTAIRLRGGSFGGAPAASGLNPTLRWTGLEPFLALA